MSKQRITLDELKRLLSYDPQTGEFVWLTRRCGRCKKGKMAGSKDSSGYIQIQVLGRFYLAHMLAWFYVTGRWPLGEIDHTNCQKGDNRFENLRESSRRLNAANQPARVINKLGIKGVVRFGAYRDGSPRYRAKLTLARRTISLGCFRCKEKAGAAYAAAARRIFGEFANSRGRSPP